MTWPQVIAPLSKDSKNDEMLAGWIDSGRFPHALIVTGPQGEARETLARRVGGVILCTGETKPCGQCKHCLKNAKAIHPDFIVVEGKGGARSFHVQQVRSLREEAWVAPNDGERKVFLLEQGEEMTTSAQNALLKVMEEPPAGVYFIITCENEYQLLTTIRSRGTTLALDSGFQGVEALSEEEEQQQELVSEFWRLMKEGEELKGGGLLSGFERDKEGFRSFLARLYRLVSEELLQDPWATTLVSALQVLKILDIIEEMTTSVDHNVNMLLLVNLTSSRMGRLLRRR